MDPEALLLFILTSQLQVKAVTWRTDASLYSRSGQDVLLSCPSASPSDTTCSSVSWIYSSNQHESLFVVQKGAVDGRSAQAPRSRLDTRCSLVIRNVSAEDAGGYTCRQDGIRDKQVFLGVLTVSPSDPGSAPGGVGEVTLRCTLWRRPRLSCPQRSLRWRDEAGAELPAEGAGHTLLAQTGCVSMVTVRRQAGANRKYTCQYVQSNKVAVMADYTPDFSDGQRSTIIAVVAAVAALGVLVVMVAVVIKYRTSSTETEDVQKLSQPADEPGIDLTYLTVSHSHPQAPPCTKVREEEVTYSTVNTTFPAASTMSANHNKSEEM